MHIQNPKNNKKVLIYSKEGKYILKKYLKFILNGGADETLYRFLHKKNAVTYIYYSKGKINSYPNTKELIPESEIKLIKNPIQLPKKRS